MSATMDDDTITVDLSKSSINKLALAMRGGKGKDDDKGGIGGLLKLGGKGMLKLGIIGVAIGGILSVVKTLAGSSPMLKQMLKLINFSVMLIFRPIGDFIGFMLRPIIVMLLRNIIIPFYKDFMPLMREWGSWFGGAIIDFFNDPETAISGAINGLNTWVTDGLSSIFEGKVDWVSVGNQIKDGILTFIMNTPNVLIAQAIISIIKKIDLSKITNEWKKIGLLFLAWVDAGILAIALDWSTIGTKIADWFGNAIAQHKADISWIEQYIKDWVWNGINSVNVSWEWLLQIIKDWAWNGLNSIGETLGGIFGFADGGQINEPIMGIGKSGRRYSFGEKGSETVIPNGGTAGGGITLNISVGNISSESDMNNFENRVVDILENQYSRRGRL